MDLVDIASQPVDNAPEGGAVGYVLPAGIHCTHTDRETSSTPLMRTSDPVNLVPPLPRPAVAQTGGRPDGLLLAVVIVTATVVSLIRIPPVVLHVVWAEDGARFLVDAITASTSGQVLRPYDGYLHLLPRVLAETIETVFPLSGFAVAVSIAAAAATGLVAGGVFWFSRSATPWLPARLTFAALTVLTPLGAVEVLGNLANLHWYLLWLTPWLLLHRPRGWSGATTAGIVALIISLTEPQLAVFAPLALWHARDRLRWPLLVGFAAGLAAQAVAMLSAPRPARSGVLPTVADTVAGYLLDVPVALVTGSGAAIVRIAELTGWIAPIAAFLLILAAGVLVVVRGTTPERLLVVAFLVGSVILWSAGYLLNVRWTGQGPAPAWPANFQLYRYGFVPGLLLAAVVVLAACVLRRTAVVSRNGRTGPGPILALTLCLGLAGTLAVGSTFSTALRSTGVSWSAQVDDADAACDALPDAAPQPIEISPTGWTVTLTCAVIEDH